MMTTNSSIVALAETRLAIQDVVFVVPDTRGFGNQLAAWWNQAVMSSSTAINWGVYPSFDDFSTYVRSALMVYCHLAHSSTYVQRGVWTESVAKIKAAWDGLSVPRYVRDICREFCRPMRLTDELVVIPYVRPELFPEGSFPSGVAPLPAFGILPGFFRAIENTLKSTLKGTAWDDFVPIEVEAPKPAPMYLATDRSLMFFCSSIETYRRDACAALRHVQRSCTLFDVWRDGPAVHAGSDRRFRAQSLVHDRFETRPLPRPRGDRPRGQLWLNGRAVDRRSFARQLGLALPQAPGPVPILPPTLLGRLGLLMMYFATEVDQRRFDEIAVGVDRWFAPGLPLAWVIPIEYDQTAHRFASQARFPSLEDGYSRTPPPTRQSKGIKSKINAKSKGKKTDAVSSTNAADSVTAVADVGPGET